MNEIKDSDIVAAYERGYIHWTEIQHITKRKAYRGEVFVSYKNQFADFRVSGEHDLLFRHRNQRFYTKRKAICLNKMKCMFYMPVSGIMRSEGANLTDDEVRLIGYVLSDGNLSKCNNAIIISQSTRYPYIVERIESTIKACGLRYGKILIKRKGELSKYHDVWHFSISHGMPRKKEDRDKGLTGWEHLEKYIVGCKTWTDAYEEFSEHQVGILLEAINEGDGAKRTTIDYTSRTYTITMGIKKDYAEKMQSLLIRRGWRCNLRVGKKNREHALYILLCKKTEYIAVAGQGVRDGETYKRKHLEVSPCSYNDDLWCITNKYGTIVTRRDGKVLIMGNCGRAIRPSEGKDGWVIDLSGTYRRFGAVSDLEITREKPKSHRYCVMSKGRQLTNIVYS